MSYQLQQETMMAFPLYDETTAPENARNSLAVTKKIFFAKIERAFLQIASR